jgi:flagellar biosynthesis GTPase FlhF
MKTTTILILGALLFLTACSKEKTIDASSDESMESSIQKVKDSLTPEEKEKFEESVMLLAFDGGNLFELAADPDGAARKMKDRLDGKTAAEVMSEAERIRVEREIEAEKARVEREIEEQKQITAEIAELEEEKKAAEAAKEQLKDFEIVQSKFYYSEGGFTRDPTIELSVKNGLDEAVSRAYFKGVLATPGRSVPWVAETFNYSISGGLEPNEEATWKLAPNMFGAWSKAPKDRNNMVLTVTVTRLDGADEEPIFDNAFSEYDRERLEELKAKLK